MKKLSKIIVSILMILNMVIITPIVFTENVYAAEEVVSENTAKINHKKITLYVGGVYNKLKITGTTKKIKWSSNNSKIATVSSSGKVTGKGKGTTTIIAKFGDEELKCKVNVKKVPTESKKTKGVIYLTFDDGPSRAITPKVLDILKKEKVKATFFVLNYSKDNEDLIKRIVKEGHTIGIHGYSHEYSKIYRSKSAFLDNVYSLQEKIEKTTGAKTRYMRFPGGSSNTVSRHYYTGIMTLLSKEMLGRNFTYYDWNISSGDAGGTKTSQGMYNNVTRNLSKKRGNMVLMHDFYSNKKVLDALPRIIKYGKKNGYTFSSINEYTPMYAQHINN